MVAVPPTRVSSSERPTRVASIRTTTLSGSRGPAPADEQPVTATLDQLAVVVLAEVGPATVGVPAGGAGRAVGLDISLRWRYLVLYQATFALTAVGDQGPAQLASTRRVSAPRP
jgi:hypothetical protein